LKGRIVSSENTFPDAHPEFWNSSAMNAPLSPKPRFGFEVGTSAGTQVMRAIQQAKASVKGAPRARSEITDLDDCRLNPEIFQGYEKIERLDHGGQGIVYRAIESATKRVVAIKVLRDGLLSSEGQRRRFSLEIELIARIRHPNIVTLYQGVTDADYLFCIMEYIDGASIDAYVDWHRLEVRRAVQLFLKVCAAVHCAHEHGVIHRDIKPSNILVDIDEEPHVLDFGLAKDDSPRAQDYEHTRISMTGQVLGTLPYLSPEQVSGNTGEVDRRSDLYSLAVVLYQLLTGNMPYTVEGPPEDVRNNILFCPPTRIQKMLHQNGSMDRRTSGPIPDDLEKVLFKALSKEKARRYPTVEAFADDLKRYCDGQAVNAKADSRWYLLKKSIQRRRKSVAIGSALFLVLLVGSMAMIRVSKKAEKVSKLAQSSLLTSSLVNLGSAARDEKRTDEAIDLLAKAAELGAGSPSDDPLMAKSRYEANHQLATVYIENGALDSVAPYRDAAVRIAEDFSRRDPSDLKWRRILGRSYVLRGNEEVAHKNFERALDHYKYSTQIRKELCEAAPSSDDLRTECAQSLAHEGQCLRMLRRFDESLRCYEDSHAILVRLLENQPESFDRAMSVVFSDNTLATWHLSLKSVEGNQRAGEWLARAEELLTKLRNRDGAKHRAMDLDRLENAIQSNKRLIERRAKMAVVRPSP
jgi:serine/threonine protein kinase